MNESLRFKPLSTLSRRGWIKTVSATSAAVFCSPQAWAAAESNGLSHNAESIHQEVTFNHNAQRIYDALTDAQKFQEICKLSDASKYVDVNSKPAVISSQPGGDFTIFGGYIVGRHIELVPNQRIVQAWREPSWAPGVYSVVHFEFSEQGKQTRLVFDHTGFPAGAGDHLAIGWKLNYWDPLDKILSSKK
jgi:activator of HSP90 ATPase